jgi:hypothetical protein
MTLDSMRAGPTGRRTSPRSSELLWRRLRSKNTAATRDTQATRREAFVRAQIAAIVSRLVPVIGSSGEQYLREVRR